MTQDNLFWDNHLRYFGTKFRSMDAQVLFRSFRAKITQSTTAITSIAIRALRESKKKINQKFLLKFLLLFALAKSRISLLSHHCEANLWIRRSNPHYKIKEHK